MKIEHIIIVLLWVAFILLGMLLLKCLCQLLRSIYIHEPVSNGELIRYAGYSALMWVVVLMLTHIYSLMGGI